MLGKKAACQGDLMSGIPAARQDLPILQALAESGEIAQGTGAQRGVVVSCILQQCWKNQWAKLTQLLGWKSHALGLARERMTEACQTPLYIG